MQALTRTKLEPEVQPEGSQVLVGSGRFQNSCGMRRNGAKRYRGLSRTSPRFADRS